MSKIRILAIPSDKHGVGKFRIMDPYKFIAENYTDDIHVDISYRYMIYCLYVFTKTISVVFSIHSWSCLGSIKLSW